jgi:hypothetical protein
MAPTPLPQTEVTKTGFSPGEDPAGQPEPAKPPPGAQNPFGPPGSAKTVPRDA